MGIRDAFQAFGTALRKGPMIPLAGGPGVTVVNTNLPPTQGDVPLDWSSAWMGPGQAFTISQSSRDKDKETEPRSFQYNPNVNATISPRLAYGLIPFTTLRSYAETVPEVSQCINIITEEMKAFMPTLVDREENIIDFADLRWMTTKPDGYYPWSVWMSRFLYNTLAYDAGCAYLVRDGDRIIAARVVDGSTIFPLVDERGEQPAPPAPAFTQVLYGTPYQYYNTRQLYYRPRHLRVESPYGRSPIEDAIAAVQLLQNLWDYEAKKYAEGNIPECLFRAPIGWSVDQVLEAERAWNARMVGSNAERVRARFIPNGFEFVLTKDIEFNVSSHDAAANAVRLAFGIPQSEVGDAPGDGLGGSGYAEAMQSAFYRMALAPNIMYVEQLFNHILDENGYPEIRFKMQFPNESINPQKEEEKQMARFTGGVVTRDEARQSLSLQPLGGELGEYLVDPKPTGQPGDMFGAPISLDGRLSEMKRPIRVEKAAIAVSDDEHSGVMVALPMPIAASVAREITWPPGSEIVPENELHVTLAYLGEIKHLDYGMDTVERVVRKFAAEHGPLHGEINGIGVFLETHKPGMQCMYLNFDCAELPALRQELVEALNYGECHVEETHGFTPHITLAYFPDGKEPPTNDVDVRKVIVKTLRMAWGDEVIDIPLTGKKVEKAAPADALAKHIGVCDEDDGYFGAEIKAPLDVEMPSQGANESLIVSIGDPAITAVWKPESGENDFLRKKVGGALYRREEAAFLLDRALAQDANHYLVPVTYAAERDGEPGSVQIYVTHSAPAVPAAQYAPEFIEAAAILDYVSGQLDRRGHNWLTHPDDPARPILIDNGLAFPTDEAREVVSQFVAAMTGKTISDEGKDSLYHLLGNDEFWQDLSACLDDEAPGKFARQRAQALYDAGAFPALEITVA